LRFEFNLGKYFLIPSQKNPSQKWLVEWLKVKALSSSPRTAKKPKPQNCLNCFLSRISQTGMG
jgi:hypothetical protein